jgi:pimeloyl-ACP methyl ester carboxylesterase
VAEPSLSPVVKHYCQRRAARTAEGIVPTLERNGVQIQYQERGQGPAILLTHGYSATSQMWTRQVEALQSDYRVITWDLRGHGRSDSPEPASAYSESAAVDDMDAILRASQVERAIIGGLSLGGYLSLAFHLAHPERVRALMLFDTGPGFKSPEARAQWNRIAEGMARAFDKRGLSALGDSAEVRVSRHRSAEGLARAARGALMQLDSRVIESLESIRVPTLVIAGERDEPFLAATDYMATKIPNSTKVIIPGAGHAANLEQPEAFDQAVRSFLSTLE